MSKNVMAMPFCICFLKDSSTTKIDQSAGDSYFFLLTRGIVVVAVAVAVAVVAVVIVVSE